MRDKNKDKDIQYIILYGNGDWEGYSGTLEKAIERAQETYWNDGHKSARIIAFKSIYFVRDEMTETTGT